MMEREERENAISNIIERVPESDVLYGDFDEADQPWKKTEKETGWIGRARGREGGVKEGRGELQSRSLTWGARVMFKRQFWHPADPGPTFFNRRRRFNSHPPGPAVPPFWDPYSPPPPEGLRRLLLTDRTKLAFPVPPKHWNCTNTLRILATRLLYAIYRIGSYACRIVVETMGLSRDGFQVNTQRINNKFTRSCVRSRGELDVDLYIAIVVYQFCINFSEKRDRGEKRILL